MPRSKTPAQGTLPTATSDTHELAELESSMKAELDTKEREQAGRKRAAPAKAGTSAAKTGSSLAAVIERQTKQPASWSFGLAAQYINQRVAAGQSEDKAIEEVMAAHRQHAVGVYHELKANGGTIDAANRRYFARELPASAARWTGPRNAAADPEASDADESDAEPEAASEDGSEDESEDEDSEDGEQEDSAE